MHRSPVFGHSIEFVQHREYTPGDDIRHLDWKVWSKTDRYYIKQYEAETNLRCHLLVDVSESMHYGRGALNKYAYGCTAGACLAYLLLRQQDAVGCITFDSDVRQIVPARSQMTHIDAVVNDDARQQAARKDGHRQDPAPGHRDAALAQHDRAHLGPADRPRIAAQAAWKCSRSGGTTSSSSTSWTRTR